MTEHIKLIPPRLIPPLDEDFRPAVLANRAFEEDCHKESIPLIIGLEREDGKLSRFEIHVFPGTHPRAKENLYYTERILKFLLWQRGGKKIFIGGPHNIGKYIENCYSPHGKRHFDYHFMGEQVYEQPFAVVTCDPSQVPAANDTGQALGRHLDGYRIGFDLGASDRKVSAVVNGKVIYSEEVIWDPRNQSDPAYHYDEIIKAIKSAASKMPRVDAIGGSAAGIYLDNRPMVASLFRSVAPEHFQQVRNLFLRIRDEMGVPLEVINDGDITALAGSMSFEDNGILGIAMGSSQAAGYIDMRGHIMGWLNELAFAPIDYSPSAPVDEWSGDSGCGAQYLSQQCVFRLAPLAGIHIPAKDSDAEKLLFVQDKLNNGNDGVTKIWRTIGIYLGYALAHYASFYELKHVLVLGRCTSGIGGELIVEEAKRVLKAEFPEIASQVQVQLPDEHSRRVGQSIAAASLPIINKREGA